MKHTRADLSAALTVAFMAVPQGIAYATIAGLPPAMGLYAAALPTMVGSFFRSSSHVVAGPTNALSLLVGEAIAVGMGVDPVAAALTLATMVGIMQVAAGALRLGAIVDFVSRPVVLGYITGAGVLIGVGQLHNLTATQGARGHLVHRITAWAAGLDGASALAVGVGLGTALAIVVLRRLNKKIPSAMVVMALATAAAWLFDLRSAGLSTVADVNPVPQGLPPLTWPDLAIAPALLPLAGAAMVLSLVESTAVGRSIAARTGERINTSREFIGQGLGNVTAGFFGGYPVSGSLSRSALNHQAGARTRMAGVYTGAMMIAALLVLGPALDFTPIAALAGLLLVIAWDLVDGTRIRQTLRGTGADKVTFLVTLVGTWSMRLDHAIYLGVLLSVVMFLRQARLLTVRELRLDAEGGLHELNDEPCWFKSVRIANLEGRLFFGVEAELRDALDGLMEGPDVRTLVLRMRRTQGMDVTVAGVLRETAERMRGEGKHLVLSGLSADAMALLESVGALEDIGREHVFPSQVAWFASFQTALEAAAGLADESYPPTGGTSPSRVRLR